MYNHIGTDYDIMKEFLIQGAELTGQYGFPTLPAVNVHPKDTIDFESSLSRTLKGHRDLNVNFYIQDSKFLRFWNEPDKYTTHLSYFASATCPDFTVDTQMPLALQIYNRYRNMALSWYMTLQGITVIPSVNVLPLDGREWLLDGVPRHSTISCCTNGRIRARAARSEFCEGFYEMCERLEPLRVVIIGRMPPELRSQVEIINLKSRNQQMEERFKHGNKISQVKQTVKVKDKPEQAQEQQPKESEQVADK